VRVWGWAVGCDGGFTRRGLGRVCDWIGGRGGEGGRWFLRGWGRGLWGGCVVGICSCGPPGRGVAGEVFHWLRDVRGGSA